MSREPTREEYTQVIYGLCVLRERMERVMIQKHLKILDELIDWMRFYAQATQKRGK